MIKLVVSKDLLRILLNRSILVAISWWVIIVYKWILRVSEWLKEVLM